MEYLFFRNSGEKLPANLLWAFFISLLIHLVLLETSWMSDGPVSGGKGRPVSLPLSATLLGAKQSAREETDSVAVENEWALGGNGGENISETVSPQVPVDSSAVASEKGLLQFPLPVAEKTENVEVKPVPVTIPGATTFFRRLELSVPPVLQDEPLIDIPAGIGKGDQKGGKLSLRLFVRSSGDVERVEIDNSNSPAAYEEAAVAAFLSLRFRPGEIDGVVVSSQVVFEIDFDAEVKGVSRSTDRANWWGSPGASGKPALEVKSNSGALQEEAGKPLR